MATAIILCYNPNARLDPDASHEASPFDGIEVHAVEEWVEDDNYLDLCPDIPGRKYHILHSDHRTRSQRLDEE